MTIDILDACLMRLALLPGCRLAERLSLQQMCAAQHLPGENFEGVSLSSIGLQ